MSNFYRRLKELRSKARITQKELANSLNVTQTAITYWENGKREPSLDMIAKIADYFNVSLESLLTKDEYTQLEKYEQKQREEAAKKAPKFTAYDEKGNEIKDKKVPQFTTPTSNNNIHVEATPEAMERLKEDAEAREIIKKYEDGKKISESEYKKVIEYHSRMIERSKLLQNWLEWYKSTCEPLNNEGRKKVAEYAETLAETDKYTKPKE